MLSLQSATYSGHGIQLAQPKLDSWHRLTLKSHYKSNQEFQKPIQRAPFAYLSKKDQVLPLGSFPLNTHGRQCSWRVTASCFRHRCSLDTQWRQKVQLAPAWSSEWMRTDAGHGFCLHPSSSSTGLCVPPCLPVFLSVISRCASLLTSLELPNNTLHASRCVGLPVPSAC